MFSAGEIKMALKALDIYKLLPKKNCKECGDPTCLTFAMKLAGGKVDVDLCPYLDDQAKSVLGATTRPPIRLVKIGVGERSFAIGEEFVLYRHDKTFYHPPGIVFRVSDTLSAEQITAATIRVRDETFTRVVLICSLTAWRLRIQVILPKHMRMPLPRWRKMPISPWT